MRLEAWRVDVCQVVAEYFQPMALRVRARCGKVESVRHPRFTRILIRAPAFTHQTVSQVRTAESRLDAAKQKFLIAL